MEVAKTNGIGGEWVKVTITIGEKIYTRNTAPNGNHQYANVGGRNNVAIRAGGKTATMIDRAIASAN